MNPDERRDRIVEMVRAQGRASTEALADALKASRETVRRDLAELSGRGRLRKVHGGATAAEARDEGAFSARMGQRTVEKRAIARAAASLFEPGDTLFLDVGTTTVALAEALADRPGLTVITNGVEIARSLGGSAKVFLVGGEYRADAGETVGALATAQLAGFYAAHAVLTVGGLSGAGAMDFALEEAEVARAMIARARSLTVVADHSKFGREALFQVCPLAEIDRLVSDRDPPPALRHSLVEAGVQIILAPSIREGRSGDNHQLPRAS